MTSVMDHGHLDTITGETSLFRALISHRLIGPSKHFAMVGVRLHLRDTLPEEVYDSITNEQLWNKVKSMYDEKIIVDGEDDSESEESEGDEAMGILPSVRLTSTNKVKEFNPLPHLEALDYDEFVKMRSSRSALEPASPEDDEMELESRGRGSARKDKGAEASDESDLTEQEDEEEGGDEEEEEEEEEEGGDEALHEEEEAPSTPASKRLSTRTSNRVRSRSISAAADDAAVALARGKEEKAKEKAIKAQKARARRAR